MVDRIRDTLKRHGMVSSGDSILVAVSGGVDSMVLLHVLACLRVPLGIRLHAAHLDHGLRAGDAEREARLVERWAGRLGVPVTVGRAGPLDRHGGSLQRAARNARYAFLEREADRVGARRIAVGHHRDDQAETVLLNLLRGAGLRGLGGIPPVRGRIIRPLLEISREEIVAYARAQGVPWVEDPSNASLACRRNRIRAELLPRLRETFHPRVAETLARMAELLRAEDAFLDGLAREALERVARGAWGRVLRLEGKGLQGLHPVLRCRALRAAAASLPGSPALARRHVLALEAWVAAGPRPGRCRLRQGVDAWWEGEELLLGAGPAEGPPDAVPLPVGVATRVERFGMLFLAELVPPGDAGAAPPGALAVRLDAAAAEEGLAIRGWRPGDRFRPLGLAGTKKLQDFFVDAKVPRPRRGRVPLIVSGDRILCVVGYRIAEGARVTAETRQVIRITARPAPGLGESSGPPAGGGPPGMAAPSGPAAGPGL